VSFPGQATYRASLATMKLCLPQILFLVVLTSPVLATRRFIDKRHNHELQHRRISPKLDPESDKTFFGHDYPDNLAAKGQLKPEFGHPYPAIQDTDKFDKDYVKDENGDDGEWTAQMEYDLLRTKVSKAKDDIEKAKAAKEQVQERLQEARKKQAEAEAAAGVTSEKVATARAEAKSAEKDAAAAKEATEKVEEQEVEDMRKAVEAEKTAEADGKKSSSKASDSTQATKNGASKSGEDKKEVSSEETVEAATAKVEKEMADLDKCQKELEKARAKLKELAEKEGKAAKAKREEHEQKVAKLEKERAEVSNEESQASDELSKSERDAASLQEENVAGKKHLSEEERAHEAAAAKAKLESTDLEQLEAYMKVAEQNLRKLRRAEDADGGVYSEKKAEPCKKTAGSTARLNLPSQGQNCEKSGAMAHKAGAATMTLFATAMTMYAL